MSTRKSVKTKYLFEITLRLYKSYICRYIREEQQKRNTHIEIIINARYKKRHPQWRVKKTLYTYYIMCMHDRNTFLSIILSSPFPPQPHKRVYAQSVSVCATTFRKQHCTERAHYRGLFGIWVCVCVVYCVNRQHKIQTRELAHIQIDKSGMNWMRIVVVHYTDTHSADTTTISAYKNRNHFLFDIRTWMFVSQ